MNERIFYCMKYRKLVNRKELKRCLARFTYYNKDGKKITGICPQLYDLLANKPYYKMIFSDNREKDKESSDYWSQKNSQYLSMLRRMKNLDPKKDIFKES